MTRYWCPSCRTVTSTKGVAVCAVCRGEVMELDRELGLALIRDMERERKDKARVTRVTARDKDLKCPKCKGRPQYEQSFRSSGPVRTGLLAGQPGNVTGQSVKVKACKCRQEVQA